MKRSIRWHDFLTINIYWFALTTRSQVLSPLIIPLLVQQFVGEEAKGTYVGIIRLWSLMVAVLVQALMGLLSDRSTHRWGRRRPFILVGTLAELGVFVAIGLSAGLQGMTGYWVLFALYILSMVASNTAHAATQGLIPDLVPDDKRGRFSGVKALLELPVPLIFVSFVIGRMVTAGNLWGALLTLMGVMVICAALAMLAPEERVQSQPGKVDWSPFVRLAVMTGAFTAIILGMGAVVKSSGGWFAGLASTPRVVLTSAVGLLGMLAAVVLGVWSSVAIGIGKEIRQHLSFTWWVTTRLSFLVASTNLATFMLYFLQERFPQLAGEQAAGPASRVIMFVGVFILLTALPSGWLCDRFGKKRMVAVAGLMATLGTAIVVLVPSLTAVYVGGCMVGAGVGFFYSANWALGTEIVPQEKAGQYLGLSNLAGAGAGAIGAYIGGPLADVDGYVPLFVIFGALFLFSLVPLAFIKERRM